MSAQEVIADILERRGLVQHAQIRAAVAEALVDDLPQAGFEVVKPELGKLSAGWLAESQRHPEATRKFALDLINATPDGARYVVVELPELDSAESATEDCNGYAEWNYPHGSVQVFDDGTIGWGAWHLHDPQKLRAAAAALLAAAVAAEKAGQTGE